MRSGSRTRIPPAPVWASVATVFTFQRTSAGANIPWFCDTLQVRARGPTRRNLFYSEQGFTFQTVRVRSDPGLDNQRSVQVNRRLGAEVLNLALPIRAKVIVSQAVDCRIDDLFQPRLEAHPLCGLDLNFEDRELDALAAIPTGFRHLAQTFPPALETCTSYVTSTSMLCLLREPGWIDVEIATQVPRQHLRLYMGHKAERNAFFQKRMLAFLFLALLPSRQSKLAPVVAEKHCTPVAGFEVFR